MICTCTYCHYTFESSILPGQCPDCGKRTVHNRPAVRPATENERDEYRRIRAEIAQEDVLFSAHRAGIQSQEETPWS